MKISPVYRPLENLTLEWDDTETLSIKDYIDSINKLAYTFDFDPEEVAKRTGLPIIGQKNNGGGEQLGGPQPAPPAPKPQKKKSEPKRGNAGIATVINALYYPDGTMPTADGSFSLEDKIRDRILNRLRDKGFDIENDIDPDLFAHTFNGLEKAVGKGFGKVEFGTPDYDFREQLRHSNAVFAAFKTHRQQNEIHALLTDEQGNLKSFDQFRKDTQGVLQNYNVNWLRTEYDTAVRCARFATDFRGYQAQKNLYPNLKWLPSVSVHPREVHKEFYNKVWPIDDSFWLTNYPGNLWNCKCRVTNTDEPPTSGKPAKVKPTPGLDGNPALTGSIFSETHPYIKNAPEEAEKAVEKFLYKDYTKVPTARGKLRVHNKHGKNEKAENVKVGTYLAEKHDYEIDLIENPDERKSADSFNHTLGCFQEYKVNKKATINAIDRALRSAKDQANDIVLWVESDISWEELSAALRPRVRRSESITHITIVRNGKDRRYSREEMLLDGFKIQQADLK